MLYLILAKTKENRMTEQRSGSRWGRWAAVHDAPRHNSHNSPAGNLPGVPASERSSDPARSGQSGDVVPLGDTVDGRGLTALPRIRMRHAGGVWRVTRDGRFHGDFSKEEYALAAVEAAGGDTVQTP